MSWIEFLTLNVYSIWCYPSYILDVFHVNDLDKCYEPSVLVINLHIVTFKF
jgi:hypothetical protein